MAGLPRRSHPLSAMFLLALLQAASAVRAQTKEPDNDLAELDKIAKAYKIEIVTTKPKFPIKTTDGTINGKAADEGDLANYIRLFNVEFQLYPPDLVKRSKLQRVILCTDLSFAGQRRNAIPDFENDTLYLEVTRGSQNKPYMRSVIHHEFFHIIDYRDDGELYKDDRWQALNPTGFKYGTGGKNAQDMKQTAVLTEKYPGFLNHYSTTGVEEDKAEVFANLIINSAYVEERAKKDPVLKAKVERMGELLASFCPDVNDAFWKRVRETKRRDSK